MSSSKDPSLTQRFAREPLKKLAARIGQQPVVGRVRHFLDGLRSDAQAATRQRMPEVGVLAQRLARRIFAESLPGLRPVINATGILCPRGFQMPLADAAVEEIAMVARDYAASADGESHGDGASTRVERLLRELTGAQAALVLATHGSAVLATLAALARGKQVIVARSQVAEVGGNYRLVDAATHAGTTLIEVGDANQVTPDDYRQAIGPQAALLLRNLPCDFSVTGHTKSVAIDELVTIAAGKQLPVVENLEAASLLDFAPLGATQVPVVGQSIVSGADLVIFGGQRCLGGPGCGIVVGARALVERISQHPLARSLGANKLTASALEATLQLYGDPAAAQQTIPLYQLLAGSAENLRHRAEHLAPQLERCSCVGRVEVVATGAYLGEGRLPSERIPSWCLAITPAQGDAEGLAATLRAAAPSVWASVENERLELNLRSVLARQDELLVTAFLALGMKANEGSATAAPAETP